LLPCRAWGEISPDKNTDRHDTTAGFTPPLLGHWSFAISCPLAPNGTAFSIRFLFVGSSFRFPLPSHARSPSHSCGSLPFEWPLQGRTCTSKSVPMLGVQPKGRHPVRMTASYSNELSVQTGVDVVDGLLDGGDLFRLFIGNFAVKFLFQRHYQFDRIQGIRAQIIHEGGGGLDLALVNAQLLHDNLLDALFYTAHG